MRLILLFLVGLITISGFLIYRNIFYINGKHISHTNISLADYKDLPTLIESWPGTQKLISTKDYKKLAGNNKVTKISTATNKIAINVYFPKPDLEDNAEERSATMTFPMALPLDFTDTAFFTIVETKGNIVGQGHQRSRIQFELTDSSGKFMRGPKLFLSPSREKTYLILRPTTTEPIPTGSAEKGFDLKNVSRLTIRFIIAKYPDGLRKFPASGELFIGNVYVISNLQSIVNFFGRPSLERVTLDNINFSYKFRKAQWRIKENGFFVGINYPWNNYGWDVGRNPYGEPANSGWSANETKLREDLIFLKSSGIEPVRIYIFFDLRTGLDYKDGKLIRFDDYVRQDIEIIFKVASQVGIKIIPVLFDFGIANSGGHPELIFSSEKHDFLVNLMRPLLWDMDKWNKKYNQPVFALELMNEPENMAALVIPSYFKSLKVWFKDLANIIHNETSFPTTLGSHSFVDMQRWWDGIDIDIWQFHFYKYMFQEHKQWPHDLKKDDLDIPNMMFCGEMQPFDIVKNIESLRNNGYSGILFWAWNTNDGYGLRDNPKMKEITDWIQLNLKEAN